MHKRIDFTWVLLATGLTGTLVVVFNAIGGCSTYRGLGEFRLTMGSRAQAAERSPASEQKCVRLSGGKFYCSETYRQKSFTVSELPMFKDWDDCMDQLNGKYDADRYLKGTYVLTKQDVCSAVSEQ